MSEQQYESTRTFKVWDYNITHRMLLVRSPKSGNFDTNIDIHFRGVSYFELPTLLNGLRITSAHTDEVERISQNVGDKFLKEDFHVVESKGRRFVIIAIAQHILENDMDIFETSLNPV